MFLHNAAKHNDYRAVKANDFVWDSDISGEAMPY